MLPPALATAQSIGGLVAGFSVTHIGFSAVREPLIERCGSAAAQLGLVGRGAKLPSFWLADTGGLEIWPDEATAGRQLYRAGYTAVASSLLFPALAEYPAIRAADSVGPVLLGSSEFWCVFAVAAIAQSISIASLFNPSPLSLVPGFEGDGDAPFGVRRDDRLKLTPLGFTRVTRHPLILPVVPWGVSNALLAGGHACDLALFIGLAIYAVAGCKAQDLRVEASAQVGTVFEDGTLERFYKETSFVPFGAIVDGRQRLDTAAREVPRVAVGAGLVSGVILEWATLQWIGISPPV
jgi:uncharacterized membrane protein